MSLIVIDNSSKELDKKIESLVNENSIVVLNKSDIDNSKRHNFKEAVMVSVKENKNIELRSLFQS